MASPPMTLAVSHGNVLLFFRARLDDRKRFEEATFKATAHMLHCGLVPREDFDLNRINCWTSERSAQEIMAEMWLPCPDGAVGDLDSAFLRAHERQEPKGMAWSEHGRAAGPFGGCVRVVVAGGGEGGDAATTSREAVPTLWNSGTVRPEAASSPPPHRSGRAPSSGVVAPHRVSPGRGGGVGRCMGGA